MLYFLRSTRQWALLLESCVGIVPIHSFAYLSLPAVNSGERALTIRDDAWVLNALIQIPLPITSYWYHLLREPEPDV